MENIVIERKLCKNYEETKSFKNEKKFCYYIMEYNI